MRKYKVKVTEEITRYVVVIAKNEDQAEEFAFDEKQWLKVDTHFGSYNVEEIEEID